MPYGLFSGVPHGYTHTLTIMVSASHIHILAGFAIFRASFLRSLKLPCRFQLQCMSATYH